MLIGFVVASYPDIDERIKRVVEHECDNRRFYMRKLMQELEDLGFTRNKKERENNG